MFIKLVTIKLRAGRAYSLLTITLVHLPTTTTTTTAVAVAAAVVVGIHNVMVCLTKPLMVCETDNG